MLVGVVETHGRQETAALLEGLETLARRATGRHRHLEFDLDAALARRPAVILMDELALRRTADRVDDQMRAKRDASGREERVWHTRDAILLCLGANTGSEKLVRIAARLAAKLGSEWHAVTVETPTLHW